MLVRESWYAEERKEDEKAGKKGNIYTDLLSSQSLNNCYCQTDRLQHSTIPTIATTMGISKSLIHVNGLLLWKSEGDSGVGVLALNSESESDGAL